MAKDNNSGCWTSSVAHTHIVIPPPPPLPPPPPQGCWTSSAAHTHILNPPYTPPKQILLSEKALHDPEPWIATTCTLKATFSAWGQYDLDLLLSESEGPWSNPDSRVSIDLDNDIHPLFAAHNFYGVRYEVMTQVLRLATLLIDTPCLMQYWYAAFYSLAEFACADNSNKSYKAIARKDGPLTAKEIAQVRLKFAGLAQHVRFFGPLVSHPPGIGGTTCAHESRLNAAVTDFQGNASDILFAESTYEQLCEEYDSGETEDPAETYFMIATLLVHELAHAVQISRLGDRVTVGFEEQPFSGELYDWTATVFNGVIDFAYGEVLVIKQWLSRRTFESYMGLYCGGTMFVQAAQPAEVDVDIEWRVPKTYIRKIFSKDFWHALATSTDAGALQVPKVLGYRKIPAGPRGCCKCSRCRLVDFYVPWSIKLGSSDKAGPAMEEAEAFNRSVEHEFPGHSDPELFELPCLRNEWDYWPLGAWFVRQYSRDGDLDPRTHGVPEGYMTLADGSMLPAKHFEKVAQWEAHEQVRDLELAEYILDLLRYMKGDDTETQRAQIKRMLESTDLRETGVLRAYLARTMDVPGYCWAAWKKDTLKDVVEFQRKMAELERLKASQHGGDHGFEDEEGEDGEPDDSGEYDSEEDDSDAEYSDADQSDLDHSDADDSTAEDSDTDHSDADDSDTDTDAICSDVDICGVQATE